MIILAVVFGSLAAAVLPMILAIAAIAIALGSAALVGQVYELNVFVQNIITMVGLAVGIDYSLFIVSRFREERARGLDKVDAIAAAGATASRAVFFSGMIVILGLVGLLIVPHSVFFSLGLGAIFVVAIAVMASLTLLPAVLGLMGDRVNKFRIPLLNRRIWWPDSGLLGQSDLHRYAASSYKPGTWRRTADSGRDTLLQHQHRYFRCK